MHSSDAMQQNLKNVLKKRPARIQSRAAKSWKRANQWQIAAQTRLDRVWRLKIPDHYHREVYCETCGYSVVLASDSVEGKPTKFGGMSGLTYYDVLGRKTVKHCAWDRDRERNPGLSGQGGRVVSPGVGDYRKHKKT